MVWRKKSQNLDNADARRALVESEQRCRRLVAASSDYIYSVSVENGISGATVHGPGCEAVTKTMGFFIVG